MRDSETFGQFVRRERLARRMPNGKAWTQEYLAERAGIDQGTVSQVELDKGRSRTSETVQRLATALGGNPHTWLVMSGVVPPLPTIEAPRTIVLPTRDGERELDLDLVVSYVESKPDPDHQRRLKRWRDTLPRADYERIVAKIYVAWTSNADLLLSGLETISDGGR